MESEEVAGYRWVILSIVYLSILAFALRPESQGLGFGVISTCSSAGLFLAPYLIGKTKI